MKKRVPDPPRLTTTHTHFATTHRSHAPLFAVCAGIHVDDALMHIASALKSANETNLQLCDLADRKYGDLLWATQQSLEIAQALVGSLLSSIEQHKLAE
ncbi:MAG: hypothetical protein LBJ37_10535 [Paucimonas sp.]|jgi:ABC-type branched-subunit amino acid transport system ATPase component|nr:hypothetical protein [Paucimonas sp.]